MILYIEITNKGREGSWRKMPVVNKKLKKLKPIVFGTPYCRVVVRLGGAEHLRSPLVIVNVQLCHSENNLGLGRGANLPN